MFKEIKNTVIGLFPRLSNVIKKNVVDKNIKASFKKKKESFVKDQMLIVKVISL